MSNNLLNKTQTMYHIINNKTMLLPVQTISLKEYTGCFGNFGGFELLVGLLYQKYKYFFEDKKEVDIKINGYYCSLDSYSKQLNILNEYLARHISTFYDSKTLELLY